MASGILNLDGLLGNVTDLLDDLLGGGIGDVVEDLAPGKLIKSLGKTLQDTLAGEDSDLLKSLLDNGVIDPALLQQILGGTDLELGALDDLLGGADLGDLSGILDGIFDDGLLGLGDTALDLDALQDLTGADLDSVVTYVTSLVAAVTKVAGDAADLDELLDAVLAGDDDLQGDQNDNAIRGGAGGDQIQGLGGNDTLSGEDGDDTLSGGAGNDVLKGGAGDDNLVGDDGADRMTGGAGDDRFEGGKGDDFYRVNDAGDLVIERSGGGFDHVKSSISYELTDNVERLTLVGRGDTDGTGNSLDNIIGGNRGDNVLKGGGGDDVITGGLGADTMTGGAGDDVFRFRVTDESGLGKQADVITDFGGRDTLNFKFIDADASRPNDQAFDFIGDDAFSGGGSGEIRFVVKNGDTFVRADLDGDGSADMAIRLEGIQDLTGKDFVL